MSSSSRPVFAITCSQSWSLGWLGRLGGIRIRRRQVRECARPRHRCLIDTVADSGPIPGVDENRKDCVHHIIVEGSSPAGLVWTTRAGGELDLEEGALLGVWLRDVHDQEVS